MPKSASLRPKHRPSRAAQCKDAWEISIPPHLSPTGKRQQLFFATQAEALIQSNALKVRKDNFGTSLSVLSPVRIHEAAKAFEIVDGLGISLLDAVKAYVPIYQARTISVNLGEAFDQYIQLRQQRVTRRHLRKLQYTKERLTHVLETPCCDLQRADLEPAFLGLTVSMHYCTIRCLRAVLNFAIRRKWAKENPALEIDLIPLLQQEVQVFEVEEVRTLLEYTLENNLKFLPFRLFSFFCGIRSEEIRRVDWCDVHFAEKRIVLRAEHTKTKSRRIIDLSDNLLEWLTEYQVRSGNTAGLIVPWKPDALRHNHLKNYRAAGLKRWIKSGARHSYCSYWLAKHESIDRLIAQSGHAHPRIMQKHYQCNVPKEEALKYWEIRPPRRAANVIAMRA
jgi:integrase